MGDNTPNTLLAPIDFTTDYNAMIVIDTADIIQQNSPAQPPASRGYKPGWRL